MSTLIDKVKMAAETAIALAKNVADGNTILVSEQESDTRMAICQGCPELESPDSYRQCKQCGCFMNVKTKLNGTKCPLGKW